jgi:hypothetical protein
MPLYLGFLSLPLLSPSSSSSQPTNLINQQTANSKHQTSQTMAGWERELFPNEIDEKNSIFELAFHPAADLVASALVSGRVRVYVSLPDSITLTETHY